MDLDIQAAASALNEAIGEETEWNPEQVHSGQCKSFFEILFCWKLWMDMWSQRNVKCCEGALSNVKTDKEKVSKVCADNFMHKH